MVVFKRGDVCSRIGDGCVQGRSDGRGKGRSDMCSKGVIG
jgi:hypothetical protein